MKKHIVFTVIFSIICYFVLCAGCQLDKNIDTTTKQTNTIVHDEDLGYVYLPSEEYTETESTLNTEQVSEPTAEPTVYATPPAPTPDSTTPHEHQYNIVNTFSPTCTTEGYTIYSCVCGNTYESDTTPSTGHTWNDWTITKKASYTEEGIQERSCYTCGFTETQAIPCIEKEIIDTAAIAAYGCAYAQSLGFTIDYSFGKSNSGYLPGLDFPIATMAEGYKYMAGCVSATMNQLMAANGTIEGCHLNCLVEYSRTDAWGDWYIIWVFYG